MPMLALHTAKPVPADQQEVLIKALSRCVAQGIGKPETYVMVTLSDGPVCMAGSVGDGAFVDVRSIGGLSGDTNGKLAAAICALLDETLSIPSQRVYLNFTNVDASAWGFDGRTFG